MKKIDMVNPRNSRSIQTEDDWGYAFGLEFDTDGGSYIVSTDKPVRAISVGAIPVEKVEGDDQTGWTFDRQVVALVANILERIDAGEYPKKGDTFEMPTKEHADATFKRLGIPQDKDMAENLYRQCTTER